MTGATGAIVWLIISVILFVVEGLTVQIVCIWFAFGGIFAMLASFVGASLAVQLLIFLVSSLAVLVVGRPLLMNKLLKKRKEPTNADRVIGQVGVVIEQIDNMVQAGRVTVDGLDWSARSQHGQPIPVGEKVVIQFIEGVKLIVLPLEMQSAPPQPQEPVELQNSDKSEEEGNA